MFGFIMQDKVWKELLMAAIGEQLNEFVSENDEICGISVSTREKEDVLLIWNTNAEAAKTSRVFECVHMLMPDTSFLSTFYKREYFLPIFILQFAICI